MKNAAARDALLVAMKSNNNIVELELLDLEKSILISILEYLHDNLHVSKLAIG